MGVITIAQNKAPSTMMLLRLKTHTVRCVFVRFENNININIVLILKNPVGRIDNNTLALILEKTCGCLLSFVSSNIPPIC